MLPSRLRISTRQRRSFVTSLFGITFLASVITVVASTIIPCPARQRKEAWAEITDGGMGSVKGRGRQRRWIEEKLPE
ncbi:hypothetical protein M422DRAFT_197547 [Sphaerobolus stellatus SS14]|nr:hypothetical protein M422DRAFT_197547 [Sphaerobolus stellatus SS14]